MAAFKAARLPIGEVTEFPAQASEPGGQYVTKVTWHDTRLSPPMHPVLIEVGEGGAVEVYADRATPQNHADNIRSNAAIGFGDETDYVHGVILVRLAQDLPPAAVAAYKRVLDGLP